MSEGLQARLGYHPPQDAAWRRLVRSVVATGPGSRVFSVVLPVLDRLWHRASGGRTTLVDTLGGLPTGFLTTTGARSGLPRTTPLIVVPCGDDLAVIGSNWGGAKAPGWVHNLRARPVASLELGGRTSEVVAELLEGPERDAVYAAAAASYVGYSRYEARAAHRTITVWRLRPA